MLPPDFYFDPGRLPGPAIHLDKESNRLVVPGDQVGHWQRVDFRRLPMEYPREIGG